MGKIYEHPLKTQTESGRATALKITLLSVSSLSVMSGAIITASLPQLAVTFSDRPYGELMAKLMLTLPSLFVAIFGPSAGAHSDRIGRRKVLISALLLFSITGCSGLYLSNPYLLLLGRAVLGIAVAAVMTVSIAFAGDFFEGPERDAFLGQQGAFMALGGRVFITFGGWLADLHWRLPFAVFGVGILLVWPVFTVFKDNTVSKKAPETTNKIPVQYDKKHLTMVYVLAFFGILVYYFLPLQLPFFLKEHIQANGIQIGAVIGMSSLFGVVSGFAFKRIIQRLDFLLILELTYLLMAISF
jgi:MFS family permease